MSSYPSRYYGHYLRSPAPVLVLPLHYHEVSLLYSYHSHNTSHLYTAMENEWNIYGNQYWEKDWCTQPATAPMV